MILCQERGHKMDYTLLIRGIQALEARVGKRIHMMDAKLKKRIRALEVRLEKQIKGDEMATTTYGDISSLSKEKKVDKTIHIDTTIDYYVILELGKSAPLFHTDELFHYETFDLAYGAVKLFLRMNPSFLPFKLVKFGKVMVELCTSYKGLSLTPKTQCPFS